MALAKEKVKSALKKKGFSQNDKGHHIYLNHRWKRNGQFSGVKTFVSHGSRKDLSDRLVSEMAKQVKLSNKDFKRLVSCDMKQKEYETIIKRRLQQNL